MNYKSKQNQADELDLQKLWGLVRDGKNILLVSALAGLILGIAYLLLVKPLYRADALLQIEEKQSGLAVFGGLEDLMSQESSAQAEIELIKSRLVLSSTVDELDLDVKVLPDQSVISGLLGGQEKNLLLFSGWSNGEKSLVIDSLEFVEDFKGQTLDIVANGGSSFSVEENGVEIAKGQVGQELVVPNRIVSLKLKELNANAGDRFVVGQSRLLKVIDGLRSSISVAEKGKGTGIIGLSIQGHNPERIKHILDSVSNNYFLQNVKRGAEEAEKSLAFLEKQIPEIKKSLIAAEENLNEYRLKSESVDLGLETKAVLEKLVQLDAKLTELQIQENAIHAMYTSQHPAYQTLMRQRSSIIKEKEKITELVRDMPQTQQSILRLTRDVELNQAIYIQLLNRAEELKILKAGTIGNVRIIDSAMSDYDPVSPRKGLILILMTMLGGLLGLGYLVLNSLFNKGITKAQEIEDEGISVIATLPISEDQIKKDERLKKKLSKNGIGNKKQLLAYEQPTDLAVEGLRSLRTSLHFLMSGNEKKVLMLTGASPGVGKSFVSANLASVLAQAGQKVVLVDADLRRGTIHTYFGLDNKMGLSSWLASGDEDITLFDSPIETLKVLPRGIVPPNPAELLMDAKFDALIEKLAREYDVVIIDTPPVLAVTDAAIISRTATASILVARYGLSHAKEIKQAFDVFAKVGHPVNAAILNAVERTASNYGYYYAYEYK